MTVFVLVTAARLQLPLTEDPCGLGVRRPEFDAVDAGVDHDPRVGDGADDERTRQRDGRDATTPQDHPQPHTGSHARIITAGPSPLADETDSEMQLGALLARVAAH